MATTQSSISRAPRPSSLADVLDLILDKGIVIDAFVRVSLLGIEVLTIDARIVIASVDTYLRFAEAVNRLDLQREKPVHGLPGLMREVTHGTTKSKVGGALEGLREKVSGVAHAFGDGRDTHPDDGRTEGGVRDGSRHAGDVPPERAKPPERSARERNMEL